ncbi:hypothetical protein SAMN04487765_3468 [Tenacibaculum sp. MAR_2010_89]|uniref:hypothetical protein n=1 Tax=Tenacibaculum sp. MAR_2010_89 TaxID=1250198 RepID=UPI00089AA12F|nr:hypothetical protein [Tenacibaculum sp. MAR_2010_89]SEE62915.1 hypothetical protein SAMN04487765_3468 [Tenacibaculum sp. MAR_2010_89]
MNANNYTYFLEVKAGKLHSYFNLRNKLINLHISVPNIDFDIISTYFLGANKKEKAIIVHISDQTKKRICNNTGGKVLLKKRIYFSEVKPTLSGEILDLNKDDKLKVYVINDFPTDFDNNKVRYFSNLRKKIYN